MAEFNFSSTSATSTIRKTVATDTNTNIGVAVVGEVVSVRRIFWRKQGM